MRAPGGEKGAGRGGRGRGFPASWAWWGGACNTSFSSLVCCCPILVSGCRYSPVLPDELSRTVDMMLSSSSTVGGPDGSESNHNEGNVRTFVFDTRVGLEMYPSWEVVSI